MDAEKVQWEQGRRLVIISAATSGGRACRLNAPDLSAGFTTGHEPPVGSELAQNPSRGSVLGRRDRAGEEGGLTIAPQQPGLQPGDVGVRPGDCGGQEVGAPHGPWLSPVTPVSTVAQVCNPLLPVRPVCQDSSPGQEGPHPRRASTQQDQRR